MKKIFISLLMAAATLNAMAADMSIAELTLTSEDHKSSTLIIAQSEDLNAGLNNGYYAELNAEGKEVQLYVIYGGKKYEQFASNAATMQDLQLGIKTNASTSYTLTASDVEGSLKIKINGVEYTITDGMSEVITLAANSVLPAAGDEANYVVNPAAPSAPEFCFNYNVLKVNGYEGKALIVKSEGGDEKANVASLPATYSLDLSAESGRFIVTLDGVDYQIDANPAVKEVKP